MQRYILIIFFSAWTLFLPAQAFETAEVLPGELIVQLAPNTKPGALLSQWGADLIYVRQLSHSSNVHLFELAGKAPVESFHLNRLYASKGVLAAQRNYLLEKRTIDPSDPLFSAQWNLELIRVTEVWEYATGGLTDMGDEIVLAVLDSGFDIDNPDLRNNIWKNPEEDGGLIGSDEDQNGYTDDFYGWNFITDSNQHNMSEHGTSVLGIAGAIGDNNLGVAGINWNVKLLPMTVNNVAQIVEAYNYARDLREKYNESAGQKGAFIVATNASLGISDVFCNEVPIWQDVYDELGAVGILNVGATTNKHRDVDVSGDLPTTCPSDFLITVTNTDQDDRILYDAGYGSISIDMSAPGGLSPGVITTGDENGLNQNFGGTSASAPHVAGAIALLYSLPNAPLAELALLDPPNTAMLMKQAILEGVDPLFDLDGITTTGGRLNVFESMKRLHELFQEIPYNNDPGAFTNQRAILSMKPNPLSPGQILEVGLGTRDFQPLHLRLVNTIGAVVAEWDVTFSPFEQQSMEIDTANLQRGMYFLIIDNGRNPITAKLVVQ